MACNRNIPDPNKHEQTPNVVRERPWRFFDSWGNIVDRRERHRHSHARTHADTHTHMCTHTDTWHSHTHTHTRRRTHARTDTHAYTHAHTHVHMHAHTKNKFARTHTHAHRHTHATLVRANTHAGTHTTRAEGITPPHVHGPGEGGKSGGWTGERERRAIGYSESISAHTAIMTTTNSGHDGQGRCMRS